MTVLDVYIVQIVQWLSQLHQHCLAQPPSSNNRQVYRVSQKNSEKNVRQEGEIIEVRL